MISGILFAAFASLVAWQDTGEPDKQIFSGPQPGEPVPSFVMSGVFGNLANKEIDAVADADGGPLLLIFVHERSRPAFGLSNALSRFAAEFKDKDLHCAICYLTDDSPEAITWMNRIESYFDPNITIGVSKEGIEGPGDYGLNRNVALTILVTNENTVKDNFALIQPALSADGQTVINAVCQVIGVEEPPKIADFMPRGRSDRAMADRARLSPELGTMLRQVIRKDATEEEVDEAAENLLAKLAENEKAKQQVGQICKRIVDGGVIENYGTPHARKYLKRWAEEFVDGDDDPKTDDDG